MKNHLGIVVGITMLGVAGLVLSQVGVLPTGSIQGSIMPVIVDQNSPDTPASKDCFDKYGVTGSGSDDCYAAWSDGVNACKKNAACDLDNDPECKARYALCMLPVDAARVSCMNERLQNLKQCLKEANWNWSTCNAKRDQSAGQCSQAKFMNTQTIERDWANCVLACSDDMCRNECDAERSQRNDASQKQYDFCTSETEKEFETCKNQGSFSSSQFSNNEPPVVVPSSNGSSVTSQTMTEPPSEVPTTNLTCEEEKVKGLVDCATLLGNDLDRCSKDENKCIEECILPTCVDQCKHDSLICRTRANTVHAKCQTEVYNKSTECINRRMNSSLTPSSSAVTSSAATLPPAQSSSAFQ